MATENFPTTLPQALLAPLSDKEHLHYRKDDIMTGPPIYEFLTDTSPTVFNVEWNMSRFDFQLFEGWWKKDILFGSLPFNIDLLVGMGLVSHECFFVAGYEYQNRSLRKIVSARLIAIEKQYNDDATIDELFVLAEMTSEINQSNFFNNFINFGENSLPDAWDDIKYGTDHS